METINGFIDHIIYRNEENGYTVFSLTTDEEDIVCVGYLSATELGENIEAEGAFVNHPVYEEQFKVQKYRVVPPSGARAVERYLASGAIKGIGLALAARIVRQFGEETFRIMEEEPERLSEVKGISEQKAREISEQVNDKKDIRDVMLFLQQYGISNTLALKIYRIYGMNVYNVMRENPYRLAEDVDGIGFRIADEIASKAGMLANSDYRIQSGILYTLSMAVANGHMFLPASRLIERTAALLEISPEAIEPILPNLMMDKKIIIKHEGEEEDVYSLSSYYAELNCARMLMELKRAFQKDGSEEEKELQIRKKIENMESELNLELDDLQIKAVLSCIKNGVSILSGGPGTGKTTTINLIIRYFEESGTDILLAAPTGRAAKRMTETTGMEAKTIHRLLELNGMSSEASKAVVFGRDQDNPLEVDVIIVDEMSMVDIFLFQSLLKAIIPGTRLIMVGDVNQLPSVGPGQVLRDLIHSEQLPTVILTHIFRQKETSDIVLNAHRINEGTEITFDNKSKDFFFLERNQANVIYKHMVQLILEKLPPYVKCSPYEIQVLTPMKKGNLGTVTLNEILQQYLNPPSSDKKEYHSDQMNFRVGDKVMQIKNNYQLEWEIFGYNHIVTDHGTGVFNGDIGKIIDINDSTQTVVIEYDDKRCASYPYSQLDEIELAYAITIHKSQGSEYPAVIMPILSGPAMLMNRNLLYTGVTRAKSCVTIMGSHETVLEMIRNGNEQKRYTSLDLRINELERVME